MSYVALFLLGMLAGAFGRAMLLLIILGGVLVSVLIMHMADKLDTIAWAALLFPTVQAGYLAAVLAGSIRASFNSTGPAGC